MDGNKAGLQQVGNTLKIYLGLGSNMGNSLKYLKKACALLESELNFMQISSVYKAAPRDYTNQPYFLNCAVSGYSTRNPREWLSLIHKIEEECHRDRESQPRRGPRTLDVDLLFWEGGLWDEPDLQVPHALLLEREFALVPLLDLEPGLIHPVTSIALKEYLKEVEGQGVELYSKTIE